MAPINKIKRQAALVELERALRADVAGVAGAVIWPVASEAIPDDGKVFQIAFLPPEWAALEGDPLSDRLDHMTRKWGQTRREFRNRVAFVIPNAAGLQAALDSGGSVSSPSFWLEIYRHVAIPREGLDSPGPVSFRLIELAPAESGASLRDAVESALAPHFRQRVTPEELAGFLHLGQVDCSGALRRVFPMEDIPRWFFTFLSLPRLRDADPLRRAVSEGVAQGRFALAYDQPLLALDELPKAECAFRSGEPAPEIRFVPGAYLIALA